MNMTRYMSNLADADNLLGYMGLKRRSSAEWLGPLLLGMGAGLAIGGGLAFFLTPYRGDEARSRVRRSASDAQRRINERAGELGQKLGITEKSGPSMTTGSMGTGSTGSMGTGSIGGTSQTKPSQVTTSRTVGVGVSTGSSTPSGGSGTGGNRGGY